MNLENVRQTFRDYIAQANARAGREWVYQSKKPAVIVAEKYLENAGSLRDYKYLCFNGVPEYIVCVDGRFEGDYNHVFYDCQWNKLDVVSDMAPATAEYEKPENLDAMLMIAGKLSEDFPAARIDLYSIQNRIYFGEITFFPGVDMSNLNQMNLIFCWVKDLMCQTKFVNLARCLFW